MSFAKLFREAGTGRLIKTADSKTVGTTAVQVDSTETYDDVYAIILSSNSDNSGTIYYGDSNVSTSNGIPIYAGETVVLALGDATALYLIADAANQKMRIAYIYDG